MKTQMHHYYDHKAGLGNDGSNLFYSVMFVMVVGFIVTLLVLLIANLNNQSTNVIEPGVPFIETSNDVAPIY